LHEENRSLYHASAVFVSNYVMALADIATGLWQEMGFEKQQAEKALLPLLKGSVHNLIRSAFRPAHGLSARRYRHHQKAPRFAGKTG
jgi:predicted short-subunit dehydrogenase-like oxidoreductase (DUF2520 family)